MTGGNEMGKGRGGVEEEMEADARTKEFSS